MYVQQERVYPQTQWWPVVLPAFCGGPWPKDNYTVTDDGSTISVTLPYLGPRQSIFACPGYNRAQGLFWFNVQRSGAANTSFGSYAYNSEGWSYAWRFQPPAELTAQGLGGVLISVNASAYQATPEGRVTCPSDMIAFGDAPFRRPVSSSDLHDPPNACLLFGLVPFPTLYNEAVRGKPADANDNTIGLMGRRHGGRWNVAFCDGHVENLRAKDLFDFSNPNVARRWNSDHQAHNVGWVAPQ